MSSSFEKRLLDDSFRTLYKQTIGDTSVEVVDEFYTPLVKVASAKSELEVPLEKLGFYFADANDKFYFEDGDKEASKSDLYDAAVEYFLDKTAGNNDLPGPEKETKCVHCDKSGKLSEMVKNEHGAGYLCPEHASDWNKDASLKTAEPVAEPPAKPHDFSWIHDKRKNPVEIHPLDGDEKSKKYSIESKTAADEDFSEEEPALCPACGGEGNELGALGNRAHFRCRDCGMDFSHDLASKEAKKNQHAHEDVLDQEVAIESSLKVEAEPVIKQEIEVASAREGAYDEVVSVLDTRAKQIGQNNPRAWADQWDQQMENICSEIAQSLGMLFEMRGNTLYFWDANLGQDFIDRSLGKNAALHRRSANTRYAPGDTCMECGGGHYEKNGQCDECGTRDPLYKKADAPDDIRAFEKSALELAGKHGKELNVADLSEALGAENLSDEDKKRLHEKYAKHLRRRASLNVTAEDMAARLEEEGFDPEEAQKILESEKTGQPLFALWNDTDGVFASHDLFNSQEEAEEYAKKFRERFATQGFYSTKDLEHIDPEDVELIPVPIDSFLQDLKLREASLKVSAKPKDQEDDYPEEPDQEDDYPEEPDADDEVKFCPECETPNQFGELCNRCMRDIGIEDNLKSSRDE